MRKRRATEIAIMKRKIGFIPVTGREDVSVTPIFFGVVSAVAAAFTGTGVEDSVSRTALVLSGALSVIDVSFVVFAGTGTGGCRGVANSRIASIHSFIFFHDSEVAEITVSL